MNIQLWGSGMNSKYIVISVLAVGLSGCASIIKGGTQDIAISTPPTAGALCSLSNSAGNWQISTPGSLSVERSATDIKIQCSKDGYDKATAVIPSHFNGWLIGNLVFGGLIGIIIDASTGASQSYPYT